MALLGNLLRGRGVRPEARDDEFTIGENGETTVDPVGNDITNHPLFLYQKTITSVDSGDFLGSVTISDDKRNLIFDPGTAYDYLAEGETVTATLTYTMRNAWGTWDSAEITLTIVGENDAPEAQDVAGSVLEDGTAVIAADFTDPDAGDSHSLSFSGANGSVIDNGDGTFTYDPNGQFEYLAEGETATDSFTYTVDDGQGGTSTATATVTITGENDDPLAGDMALTASEDADSVGFVAARGVVFTDPDTNDTHSFSVSPAANGQASATPNGVSFELLDDFQYLHAGETATETFTYTVEDNHGGSDTATVTVTITGADDDATISGDTTGDVEEDGTLTTGGTLTVTDPDHDQSAYQAVAPAALEGIYGDFTFDTTTGEWSYALRNGDANVNALTEGEQVFDTLTVTSLDGSASETITVTITGNNNAPTSLPVDLGATDEDTVLLITQADLLANAADTDGDVLTASGLQILSGNGAVMDNGDGTWSYTPALNDDTDVSFGYAISDGEVAIAAMANLDITPVNDAPVAMDDDFTADVYPDLDTLHYRNSAFGIGEGANGVTYYAQTFTADAGALDALSFLTAHQNGTDAIEFRVLITEISGTGAAFHPTTVLFDSGPLTGATPASSGFVTTRVETGGLNLVEGQRYAMVIDLPAEYDGVPGYGALGATQGTDRVPGESAYIASANSGNRADDFASGFFNYSTIDVALSLEYGPPALTDEDTAVTIQASELLANDTDVEGDVLSIGSVSGLSELGAAVKLNSDGSVSYDPRGSETLQMMQDGDVMTDSFTYTVDDGHGGSDSATVTFDVTGRGGLPVFGTSFVTGDVYEENDMFGGPGNQVLVGGAFADTMFGGDGDDTFQDTDGNDVIFGGAGNDTVTAWFGDDSIWGGIGDDLITGQIGNDILYGGWGSDLYYGGEGADRFVIETGDPNTVDTDLLLDFNPGEGDRIISEIPGLTSAADFMALAATGGADPARLDDGDTLNGVFIFTDASSIFIVFGGDSFQISGHSSLGADDFEFV